VGAEKKVATDPRLGSLLEEIVAAQTAGSPMKAEVRWTNLKTSDLVQALAAKGVAASRFIVQQATRAQGLVRRKMRKVLPGKEVAQRDEQFKKIAEKQADFRQKGLPILSIDTKKKEFIGQLYRAGKSYCAQAVKVYDHDFPSLAAGVIVPHGIYDLTQNKGYVSLGQSKDTSEFLCDNLRYHWHHGIQADYPNATQMLLLLDGGGSNSCLHYIVKEDLQNLANELQVKLTVAHYPAYCSKYNPIEHRLFPHLQRSWEGVVFENYQIVKERVEQTTTATGLQVVAWFNEKVYQNGRKYSENFKEQMTIVFDQVLPKWNYQIEPL
jgi:Rhodopirellula transposase DDE domain